MGSFIFNYVEKEDLYQALKAFHGCTSLFTQLLDEAGRTVFAFGDSSNYCNEFRKHLPQGETCSSEHFKASKRAVEIGDAYIFCCHSGLYHIVYPLITKSAMLGSVIVGPFLMDEPDAEMILDLEKHYDIPSKSLIRMAEYSHELMQVDPERVREISKLLFYLLNSLITGSRELQDRNHEKLLQQSKINESIQMYKSSGFKDKLPYPIEKEKLLIDRVRAGNITDAHETFNDLLAYLMIYENHSISDIKIRITELCTLLSRAAVDKGADIERVFSLNTKLTTQLWDCKNIEDVGYLFQQNMEIFTDSLFYTSNTESNIIRDVTEYILEHFSEDLSLTSAAKECGVNPSYLSVLFKNVTGVNFNEHVNKVRIEEAKRLLGSTDFPVLDVAIACGFNDQSYFTKVFKKYTGLTPRQFRG